MARANATMQRLYIDADLTADAALPLDLKQTHYLRNVLRLEAGASLLLFNGRDGEWLAALEQLNKKQAIVRLLEQTRPQDPQNDIWLLVAPVKKDRLDYLAQKATEMGVGRLQPVITQRTQGSKGGIKHDKLVANSIEAAEQCNIMCLPEIAETQKLQTVLADFPSDRQIIFCDEEADVSTGGTALAALRGAKLALLIGPEGGFDDSERALLLARDNVTRVSLGPRILRTDTAVVAALALVQSQVGDW